MKFFSKKINKKISFIEKFYFSQKFRSWKFLFLFLPFLNFKSRQILLKIISKKSEMNWKAENFFDFFSKTLKSKKFCKISKKNYFENQNLKNFKLFSNFKKISKVEKAWNYPKNFRSWQFFEIFPKKFQKNSKVEKFNFPQKNFKKIQKMKNYVEIFFQKNCLK